MHTRFSAIANHNFRYKTKEGTKPNMGLIRVPTKTQANKFVRTPIT